MSHSISTPSCRYCYTISYKLIFFQEEDVEDDIIYYNFNYPYKNGYVKNVCYNAAYMQIAHRLDIAANCAHNQIHFMHVCCSCAYCIYAWYTYAKCMQIAYMQPVCMLHAIILPFCVQMCACMHYAHVQ